MAKSIEIKGSINVDKKGMSEVKAGGTCASASNGIVCKSYKADPQQRMASGRIIVDTLLP